MENLEKVSLESKRLILQTISLEHTEDVFRDALKDWVDKNLEYNYLSYPVDKRNIPSRKIAESLGGKVFREFQQINKSGYLLDEFEYRIYK